jgi:hypothetical protein
MNDRCGAGRDGRLIRSSPDVSFNKVNMFQITSGP